MNLGNKTSNSSTSNNNGYRKLVTVKSVEIKYDHKEKWQKKNNDVSLKITYNLPDKDFTPELTISGNFNREKPSWGSAFKVERFFSSCGVRTDNINDDWTIPDSWLDEVIGKEFSLISYKSTNLKPDGSNYYNEWDIVMHPSKGSDAHKADFMKSVNDGYVYNYASNDPMSAMDNDNTTSPVQPAIKPQVELNTAELEL
tara:strand:- start:5170 stop:5766 length:597 start_codon:yes stop_codon:yes gene_type:complete